VLVQALTDKDIERYVFVCVYIHTHAYVCIYIYIYIYIGNLCVGMWIVFVIWDGALWF
jgi:hypothetical protein